MSSMTVICVLGGEEGEALVGAVGQVVAIEDSFMLVSFADYEPIGEAVYCHLLTEGEDLYDWMEDDGYFITDCSPVVKLFELDDTQEILYEDEEPWDDHSYGETVVITGQGFLAPAANLIFPSGSMDGLQDWLNVVQLEDLPVGFGDFSYA